MKKIMCPIDFSESSLNALNYAVQVARQFNSKLILFHAIFIPSQELEENLLMPIDLEARKEEVERRLEEISKGIQLKESDIPVAFYLKFGTPENEILDIIKEQQIDMVIMGTKGAEGFIKLFGTVSSAIALKASCPVLIIPEKFHFKKINHIVYATDVHGNEHYLIKYIISLAKLFNAHISYLNIQKKNHEGIDEIIGYGLNMINKSDYQKMSFHVLENENILKGINSFAQNHNADMIVMSANERNALQRLFLKSNTKEEVFQAQVPLLALHKEHLFQL